MHIANNMMVYHAMGLEKLSELCLFINKLDDESEKDVKMILFNF